MPYEETVHFGCCWEGCGHVVCMSKETEAQYRQSGAYFKCPAGHDQHFTDRESKDKLLAHATEMKNRFRENWHDALQMVAELKVENRTCPVCGERRRTRPSMIRHLLAEHVTQEEWARVEAERAERVEAAR